jgi:hypothetical protein
VLDFIQQQRDAGPEAASSPRRQSPSQPGEHGWQTKSDVGVESTRMCQLQLSLFADTSFASAAVRMARRDGRILEASVTEEQRSQPTPPPRKTLGYIFKTGFKARRILTVVDFEEKDVLLRRREQN